MSTLILFLLLFSFVGFLVSLAFSIRSLIKKDKRRKNAYISGSLLLSSFLFLVLFGTTITDEDKVMTDQRSTIQAQENDIGDYEEQVIEMENEIEDLNEQIEQFDENKNDSETGNKELESTIEELEETIEDKDLKIKELTEKEEDNEVLNSKIEELEKSLDEMEEENSKLSEENEELNKDNERTAEASEKEKEDAEKKTDNKKEEKASSEEDIEKIIKDSNGKVKDVVIEKDGDLYQPNVVIDGTGYLFAVESSAKGDIADVVYALKESDYEYGFINIQVEMEFIDQYGNSNISTGYEAEFTQEILDNLTDDKYMVIDKIDGAANYWFAHPGI